MDVEVVDFETYWTKTHSLSKMSPLEYVMHEDTEVISVAVKRKDSDPFVIFGENEIASYLRSRDYSDTMLVGHNMSGFDALILAWRFGVRPKAWGCTLAMARPIHAITVGNSLAKLVKHYELGEKDNSILLQTQGKRLVDFVASELAAMERYNAMDAEQCYQLFHKLLRHYSKKELWHIDNTVRMLVEPALRLDRRLLEDTLKAERLRKQTMLRDLARELDVDDPEKVREVLASASKFSAFLKAHDVSVPLKPSPTNPDNMIPALAKTDEGMLALTEHEDELISLAARTRIDVKSTLLESRLEAFILAGRCTRGKWPVPLNYCGAITTGRHSGWLYNPQNLPRIPRDKSGAIVPKPSNSLRRSVRAPKGSKIGVADLSGIELRVNHFLWKVPYSMALFKANPDKADLYKDFAFKLYGVPLESVDKNQRQVGKMSHLGLGFGAGAATFRGAAKAMGGIELSLGEAELIKTTWRNEHPEIVQGWQTCHETLPYISSGLRAQVDPWGLVHTCSEGLVLPSGRLIRYPQLRREASVVNNQTRTEWMYGSGRHKARIYGGKIDENIVQALARDVIFDNAYDIYKRTGCRPSLMVHDELVYVAPDSEIEGLMEIVHEVMRTPPAWWPELVTWSDGDIADSYGEAK